MVAALNGQQKVAARWSASMPAFGHTNGVDGPINSDFTGP
jgi:hypothetical protein